MHISIVAMNRIAETQAEKDPSYREGLKRHGKMLLSDARKLSDAELLGKLTMFNIVLDRESFPEQCAHALSAEDLGRSLERSPTFRPARRAMDEDWLWLGLTVLWERWCPNVPSFERLDDRMQQGYLLRGRNSAEACDRWLEAWSDVVALARKRLLSVAAGIRWGFWRIAVRFQLDPGCRNGTAKCWPEESGLSSAQDQTLRGGVNAVIETELHRTDAPGGARIARTVALC